MGAMGQGRHDQDDTFCIELIGLFIAWGDFGLGGFWLGGILTWGILSGGILARGDFGSGDFVRGDFGLGGGFVQGDFVQGDFVLSPQDCSFKLKELLFSYISPFCAQRPKSTMHGGKQNCIL